jgi:hypothetical protein
MAGVLYLFLECGDLAPLWPVATCRDHGSVESRVRLRRQAAEDQSGAKPLHSKERNILNAGALAAYRNDCVSHRKLSNNAVVARPLKRHVDLASSGPGKLLSVEAQD